MGTNHYSSLITIGCFILAAVVTPSFCNKVVMGSEVSGSKVNLLSETGTRFVTASSDDPVAMYNNIEVSKLADSVPSEGAVKAYTYGSLREGGGDLSGLFQTVTFEDVTSVYGSITKFNKYMSYSSALYPEFFG